MNIKRPMLACTIHDMDEVIFPVIASPKLDGIRVYCHPVLGPVTRKFKPVPNHHIRKVLSDPRYYGYDGEIVAGNFNETQSAVMSHDGEPAFSFVVFDIASEKPYEERIDVEVDCDNNIDEVCELVDFQVCVDADELREYAAKCLEDGYEGICFRAPNSPYKEGRSTTREQYLCKYKEFEDAEGTVIEVEELYHNDNPAEVNELGLTKRSHKAEGKRPAGVLGALVLETKWGRLKVGSGYTAAQREEMWRLRDSLVGLQVSFKFQPFGMKDVPRFPVFKGVRSD